MFHTKNSYKYKKRYDGAFWACYANAHNKIPIEQA